MRITLSKIDDAERVVDDLKKIKCREDDAKFNFYDENHEFANRSDNEPDLRYFIELLNILDQELLADESMVQIRRNWKPDEPIQARASWTPKLGHPTSLLTFYLTPFSPKYKGHNKALM